eukprot:6180898-Pleurochrysis_carterae.AAC.1
MRPSHGVRKSRHGEFESGSNAHRLLMTIRQPKPAVQPADASCENAHSCVVLLTCSAAFASPRRRVNQSATRPVGHASRQPTDMARTSTTDTKSELPSRAHACHDTQPCMHLMTPRVADETCAHV